MSGRDAFKTQAQYNAEIHRPGGIGQWRRLYLELINHLNPSSVIELGAGSTDFLSAITCSRKVAIDANNKWEEAFRKTGAEFVQLDLDHGQLPPLGVFDIAVCSDVFEHLLYPDRTLDYLSKLVGSDGVLLSHVPNEFSLVKTVKIMLGLSESLYFHHHCEEHNDPHLHRFTKLGFEKFLRRHFQYNLFISDLRFGIILRLLRALRAPIPYCLQGGPTYISTNNKATYDMARDIKGRLYRQGLRRRHAVDKDS
jgi:SAM-dependent methyltransferase